MFILVLISYVKKCNSDHNTNYIINNIKINDNSIDKALDFLEEKDHKYISMIYDTLSETPAFLRIKSKIETEEVINILLGNNKKAPLYAYTNRSLIAPPNNNKRTYGWHNEIFYTIPESIFIQTWAPLLRDTTVENGTIHIAVKSHKEDLNNIKYEWIEKEGYATQIIVNDNIVNKYKQIQIPMKLRDMLFFSGKTIHKSGNNISDKYRFSLVGMYHDVNKIEFRTPNILYKYNGKTPKEYYDYLYS